MTWRSRSLSLVQRSVICTSPLPRLRLGGGVRLGDGDGRTSVVPVDPAGRPNAVPSLSSVRTKMLMITGAGCTTTTVVGLNVGHGLPVYVGGVCAGLGEPSGFPHAHLDRGTPYLSTSTAVPRCRIAWYGSGLPLTKPLLVTRVSLRSTTGVSSATNAGIWSTRTLWPPLHDSEGSALSAVTHACAFCGLAWR